MSLALECKGLEVEAGGTRILGPLDLAVEAGAHVLLCGPSGCGKTTLLRAVAGLVRPVKGTIAIDGRPVSEGPSLRVPRRSAASASCSRAAPCGRTSACGARSTSC